MESNDGHHKVVCEGTLEKKGGWDGQTFQTRYFVIRNRKLYHYRTRDDAYNRQKCRGVINMDVCWVGMVFTILFVLGRHPD